MNFNTNLKLWLPVYLYAGLIFLLSSLPGPGIPIIRIDMTLLHIPEFFILSYLIFRATFGGKVNPWHAVVLSIIISTLYGVSDEIHQLFVPGRYFSLLDILLNFIGSSLILFKIRKGV